MGKLQLLVATGIHQVIGIIKNINESSQKTTDIIGAIDGIAFRTSIFVLNAAVEAARGDEWMKWSLPSNLSMAN